MPQISQLAATYLSQIFWLVLTFGLVFLVVGRGMLPTVQRTMDDREARIGGDIAAAAAARDAATAAEDAWQQRDLANREHAQALVAEARGKAAKASEATLAVANGQHAEKVAAAEASIREASARAVAEIEGVAADAAQAIVARVSGTQVSADDARRAVASVLHA